jgi:hypothetical protein
MVTVYAINIFIIPELLTVLMHFLIASGTVDVKLITLLELKGEINHPLKNIFQYYIKLFHVSQYFSLWDFFPDRSKKQSLSFCSLSWL